MNKTVSTAKEPQSSGFGGGRGGQGSSNGKQSQLVQLVLKCASGVWEQGREASGPKTGYLDDFCRKSGDESESTQLTVIQ